MPDASRARLAAFEELLEYLKQSRAFDFTAYKRATLMRRVLKRMQAVGQDEFDRYRDYLERNPGEVGHLFNMILINVTSFFRDEPVWHFVAAAPPSPTSSSYGSAPR